MSTEIKKDNEGRETNDPGTEDCCAEQQTEQTEEVKSLEQLQQELAEKTAQAEEYYQQMLRLQAEFDNFRRRTRQEKADLIKYADEELITELLPVLDNFDRALAAADNTGEDFVSGVELIYRQLKDILANRGLEVIPTVGEEFDPNKHEAVMQVESEEFAENIVAEEFRRGYLLKGRVIRAAMVKVAK